ncbi:hypothetical protein KFK09_027174 [Dendrobium nobile]|uniref:Uncharacterized protein n=1 Tax=Dendrobium nobile TaxID=94219 RepID=A0A8T3A9T5_DENNO|nr:hypothetical protein KFK09_027174 [Dendrobium nobile]
MYLYLFWTCITKNNFTFHYCSLCVSPEARKPTWYQSTDKSRLLCSFFLSLVLSFFLPMADSSISSTTIHQSPPVITIPPQLKFVLSNIKNLVANPLKLAVIGVAVGLQLVSPAPEYHLHYTSN